MIGLSLISLAEVTGGQLYGSGDGFSGVCIDSRAVVRGQLFVALSGSRVDGHQFLNHAQSKGAAAALVERRVDGSGLAQVVCGSCLDALGKLAAFWRSRWSGELVMITGSNGKTTVKNLLASILGRKAPCLATSGNYNNEIGLPLTLFDLSEKHKFAVLEAGAGKPGDIRYLADIGQPDLAIINNAGPAHLEAFGNLETVAATKGELLEQLSSSAKAVLNKDDPFYPDWLATSAPRKVVSFGRGEDADVCIIEGKNGQLIHCPAGAADLNLSLPGKHNLANAAAAAAAAWALGLKLNDIVAGLEAAVIEPGRLQFKSLRNGRRIIDDSYNANPASVAAAIEVLTSQPGETWLVLGDMLELGEQSLTLHEECGRLARAKGVDRLFSVGEFAASAASGFGSGATHFANQADLVRALKQAIHPDVCCLVKGSRGANMQRIVASLVDSSTSMETRN